MIFSYFYFSKESSTSPEDELFKTIPNEQTTAEQPTEVASANHSSKQPAESIVADTSIVVDIKGAVKNPGVYKMDADSRVMDAVLMAGGYTKNAESRTINHAQHLQDEMVIYVPKVGEEPEEIQMIASAEQTTAVPSTQGEGQAQSGGVATNPNLVNINTADEAGLTTLTGVGPAKAQAIIAYRTENGPYKTIEELKNVTGIGEKTFGKLKDSLTVN